MTADRMTEEEARERLAFYATFSDAVDQIINAHDALAVLVDWPKLLEAGERVGRMEPTGDRSLIVRGRRCDLAHWRLVPEEVHGDG